MNTSGNRHKVDCRIVSPSLLSLVTFDFTGPVSCEEAQFPMPVHSPPTPRSHNLVEAGSSSCWLWYFTFKTP